MKALIVLTCFSFVTAIAWPQEVKPSGTETDTAGRVTKIVRVRYQSPLALSRLLRAAGGAVQFDDDLKVIVLTSDAAQVAALEKAIRELDVPSTERVARDIELTVRVIGGSNSSENPGGSSESEDLAPVVRQLRAVFPYKSYQPLSSMLLRSREGAKAGNDGIMKNPGAVASYSHPGVYSVRYDSATVSSEAGKPTIHLANFQFNIRFDLQTGPLNAQPMTFQPFGVSINTEIDLREGQKVVVGKANVENSDSAVFVVLTARLAE